MREILAVIRFVLFFAMTLGVCALWTIGDLLTQTEASKRRWREFILETWARWFVRIANARITVEGTPPAAPFLLVSNHLGYFDIAALRSVVKCVFVSKAEVRDWAIVGRVVEGVGTIFINRTNRRDIPRAGGEIVAALERGEGVVIFPEGTSSNGETMLPFNSSFLEFATKQNLPVHYASIAYRTPPGEPPASYSVNWWDDTDFVTHAFRMFRLPEFYATIRFGEHPIRAVDRKALAKELQRAVEQTLVSNV